MHTFISYKDKLPVMTHRLIDAINACDRGSISMFIDDTLIFSMYRNKVIEMINNKTIVDFINTRIAQIQKDKNAVEE